MKKYKVTLDAEEREGLHELIAAGRAAARKLTHARILLKADAAEGGPAWPDGRIAEAMEVSVATVERVRQRFVGVRPVDHIFSAVGSPPMMERSHVSIAEGRPWRGFGVRRRNGRP